MMPVHAAQRGTEQCVHDTAPQTVLQTGAAVFTAYDLKQTAGEVLAHHSAVSRKAAQETVPPLS